MAGNDKKTGSNPVDIIVYGMMIAAVVYVIVQCILGNNDALHFKIVLGIWIVAAVAVADYIGPVLSGRISEVSDKALRLYMISSILDAAAYMGFYVCIINISKTGEVLHYLFCGFGVICYISHLILNSKFNKLTKQEAPETEENETPEITEDDIEIDTLSEEDEEEIKEIVYRHK